MIAMELVVTIRIASDAYFQPLSGSLRLPEDVLRVWS
jgi:hypothetical protein